jgi:pumilio family protein 6
MFLVQGDTSENEVDGVTDEDLEGMQIVSESKKDPLQRRHELLVKSELAEVMPVPISLKNISFFKEVC